MPAKRRTVLLIVVALIAGSECPAAPRKSVEGYDKKLVGRWEATGDAKDEQKIDTITIEFKADGTIELVSGPFDLAGTYKVTKEEGKVLSLDVELASPFGGEKDKDKLEKRAFKVTFEDADTMTMTPTDKPDPKKLKRKK